MNQKSKIALGVISGTVIALTAIGLTQNAAATHEVQYVGPLEGLPLTSTSYPNTFDGSVKVLWQATYDYVKPPAETFSTTSTTPVEVTTSGLWRDTNSFPESDIPNKSKAQLHFL